MLRIRLKELLCLVLICLSIVPVGRSCLTRTDLGSYYDYDTNCWIDWGERYEYNTFTHEWYLIDSWENTSGCFDDNSEEFSLGVFWNWGDEDDFLYWLGLLPNYIGCTGTGCVLSCPNRIYAYDGNAHRSVSELTVPGAAAGALHWIRYHNTIERDGLNYFGRAGGWRHSFQFDLTQLTPEANHRTGLGLIFPAGERVVFDKDPQGIWRCPQRPGLRMRETDHGLSVTTEKLGVLDFTRVATADGKGRYEMRQLTDAHGRVSVFTYNEAGYLTKVTEPAGRFFELTYKNVPFRHGQWTPIASLAQKSVSGSWTEVSIPETLAEKARYLRIRSSDGSGLAIAEVSATDERGKKLNFKVDGTGDNLAALTDQDDKTVFTGSHSFDNACWLDFGPGGATPKVIRLLLADSAKNSAPVVEVLTTTERLRPTLVQVTGSNGLSVSYDYEVLKDPKADHEWVALSKAHYGDDTQAEYSYDFVQTFGRPQLMEADDPRYDKEGKRVRYAYHDRPGMVRQEINPATGGVYVTMDLDPAAPEKRIVTYSDLRTETLVMPESTLGRPSSHTDSLGRTTTFEYADGGTGPCLSITDYAGRATKMEYDANGRLIAKSQGAVSARVDRDSLGRVVKKSRSDGASMTYVRDAAGQISSTVGFDGLARTYTYDSLGRVVQATTDGLPSRSYHYNDLGLIDTISDSTGRTTKFTFDARGRAKTKTDALGHIESREQNERGLVTKLTDANGVARTFAYDKYGRKIHETDEFGSSASRTYDELGRVSSHTDKNGKTTTYSYASLPAGCSSCALKSKASTIVDGDGSISKYLYDAGGRLISQTARADTPEQKTTINTYDLDNRLTSTTTAAGKVTRFERNPDGAITKVTMDGNALIENLYDGKGRQTKTTDFAGHAIGRSYDDAGRLTAIDSPQGRKIAREYDSASRLKAMSDNEGMRVNLNYDSAGRFTGATDRDARKLDVEYDTAGRVTKLTTPEGEVESTSYDLLGRVSQRSAGGLALSYAYDPAGNVVGLSDNLGRTFSMKRDAGGRLIDFTDPKGRHLHTKYDAADHVIEAQGVDGLSTFHSYDEKGHLASVTDRLGRETQFRRDEKGRLASLVDAAGNQFTFERNRSGRVIAVHNPDGTEDRREFDANGNVLSFTNPAGEKEQLTYDKFGRIASRVWTPAGSAPDISYTYDDFGRIATESCGAVVTKYSYDSYGRLVSQSTDLSQLLPGFPATTLGYIYDRYDRPITVRYPSGAALSRFYGHGDRLARVEMPLYGISVAYSYDAKGDRTRIERSNGVITDRSLDVVGAPIKIDSGLANGGHLAVAYEYDELGRQTARTTAATGRDEFTYDALGQIASASYSVADDKSADRSTTYKWDKNGNKLSQVEKRRGGDTFTTALATDSMSRYVKAQKARGADASAIPGADIAYDRRGNVTARPSEKSGTAPAWKFNGRNQLTEIDLDGVRWLMTYDAKGRCVARIRYVLDTAGTWKRDDNQSLVLVYDGDWNVIEDRDLSGAIKATYVHGPQIDEIAAATVGGRVYFPITDSLGSPQALTDGAGNIAEQYSLSAFGQPEFRDGANNPAAFSAVGYRFLYAGREWLGEAEIYDFRHRAYDPTLGKFLQPDAARFSDELTNSTRAMHNNPVSNRDPLGMYQPDGHFYATFSVKWWNDPYGSVSDAFSYAYWSEYPDEEQVLDAKRAGLLMIFFIDYDFNHRLMSIMHSLHGGDPDKVAQWRTCVRDQLSSYRASNEGFDILGFATHSLGDAFAHVRSDGYAYSPPLGHAWDSIMDQFFGTGTDPDIPYNNSAKFLYYILYLDSALGGAMTYTQVTDTVSSFTACKPYDTIPGRKSQAVGFVFLNGGYVQAGNYDPDAAEYNNGPGTRTKYEADAFMDNLSSVCNCP